jgi:hypothetical protein
MVDTEVVSRPVTVLVATAALIVAMMTLILGMQQATVHYALPTPTGVSTHSVVYAPGVFAAGVAATVALLTGVWLVVAAVGRSTVWMVFLMLGVLVVDVVVLIVVNGLVRPTF